MEQNINIAALLKDCPKGTKLYSPICGDVEFIGMADKRIRTVSIVDNYDSSFSFDCCGHYCPNMGECLLFPSKEIRDWGCFNVQMTVKIDSLEGVHNLLDNITRAMLEREMDAWSYAEVGDVMYTDSLDNFWKCAKAGTPECEYILANATRAEFGKPRFKVGDVVKCNGEIMLVVEDYLTCNLPKAFTTSINSKNCDEGVFATPEEIAKWNKETLEPNHLHYSKSKRKIIDWFLPFDKCLMRNSEEMWFATIFGYYGTIYEGDTMPYINIAFNAYSQCLPYNEKTAKLIGTTDDWEED